MIQRFDLYRPSEPMADPFSSTTMSSDSSPPVKRQRTENQQITRSESFWLSDGSIVLQADETQFRVHWGLLASMHSPFFRDLQALPQPPTQPNIEGCPVVELQDDAVADVGYLLKALYTPSVHYFTLTPSDLQGIERFCPRLHCPYRPSGV